MTLVAEQIVKGLLHHGIRVAVTTNGDLSLCGRTSSLTEEERLDLLKHKPEVVHYLTEQPITPVVMYVASDLEHWTTDEPHIWADKVTLFGKQFVRLTPEIFAWFLKKLRKAETACQEGKIPLNVFARIVKAFSPVYGFARSVGLAAPPGS